MDFLVTFIGYIREDLRPKEKLPGRGFQNDEHPKQVYQSQIVRVQEQDSLFNVVGSMMAEITKDQGMMASKDPLKIEKIGDFNQNRIFIPMTMMSGIEATVKSLTNETPMFAKGRTILGDGSEPVVQ